MVDIETLGTKPGSAITQIAAVEFCPATFAPSLSFNVHITKESCLKAGLTSDPATLKWLAENNLDKTPEKAVPLEEALKLFTTFLRFIDANRYWCRGTSFDFPLLEHAYRSCPEVEYPKWNYWEQYDLRTVWNLASPRSKPAKAAHDALQDCFEQIKQLQLALEIIRVNNNKANQ